MSDIRIAEFHGGYPGNIGGQGWFFAQGSRYPVRLDRGAGVHVPVAEDASIRSVSWVGYRVRDFGTLDRGALVYMIKYTVPPDFLYEFDAWFQYEHMPLLLQEVTWYGCEFFRSWGVSSYTYAALHYIEPEALRSDARQRSMATPWWHRLERHDWFDKQFARTILERN